MTRTPQEWQESLEQLWFLESPLGKGQSLSDHLGWLVDQGGFVLDVSTLARLGRLGVPLILDLYPPAAEDGMEEGVDP